MWSRFLRTARFLALSLLLTGFSSGANEHISIHAPAPTPPDTRLIAAKEHILSLDAWARFNPDGSMEVQESIKVLTLGKEIRRGIFRSLPLNWHRQDGKVFGVNYTIKSVTRNGSDEPFRLDGDTETLNIRVGNPKHILKPGIYNYEIRYQVSNHFSRFNDWDELYWNVTGNSWKWPIDKASFHLALPQGDDNLNDKGRDKRLRTIDVYTGAKGAKEHNATILPEGSIQTSRPLAAGEGLTVVYTWPRTVLANSPDPVSRWPWVHLLIPTPKTSVIWIPLLLMIGWYWRWWHKNITAVGLKMPPVVPLFSVPDTLSPGYLRYVTQRKYDEVAFSSDLLSLIAKRGMALTRKKVKTENTWQSQPADEQWLTRLPEKNIRQLNSAEQQLLSKIFIEKKQSINLSTPHQKSIQDARKWRKKRAEVHHSTLFRPWSKPLQHCIFIALLMPIICGAWFSPRTAFLTIPALLFFIPGILLLPFSLKCLLTPLQSIRKWGLILAIFAVVFGPFAIIGSGLFMFGMQATTQIPAGYIGALLTAAILCELIGWKTPRYTQQGLNELAIAKGLELYIKTAEEHRLQTLYPPEQLIHHFESILPAALALGVGKTWADTFSRYLASTNTTSEIFEKTDWGSVQYFSQSCTKAAKAPVGRTSGGYSSGSGSSGGGSSGGGSGGGGGGGW